MVSVPAFAGALRGPLARARDVRRTHLIIVRGSTMATPDFNRLRRAAACAIIFNAPGRVLLHRRTDNGRWALPGGAIEIGETADQAVVREVREETGYEVEVLRLVGVYSDPRHTTIRYPDGNISSYVALAFACRVIGGSPALSDETSAVEWFDPQAPARLQPRPCPSPAGRDGETGRRVLPMTAERDNGDVTNCHASP